MSGSVFTTNYDLMLYWAVVRSGNNLNKGDGFPYFNSNHALEWRPHSAHDIVYLHGALHLFEENGQLKKFVYHLNARLIEQIRANLRSGRLPIYVAEADSADKMRRIRSYQKGYLNAARLRFKRARANSRNVLFVIGQGLAEQDAHIRRAIGSGKLSDVFLGTFDDGAKAHMHVVAAEWARDRAVATLPSMRVHTFDTAHLSIWTKA